MSVSVESIEYIKIKCFENGKPSTISLTHPQARFVVGCIEESRDRQWRNESAPPWRTERTCEWFLEVFVPLPRECNKGNPMSIIVTTDFDGLTHHLRITTEKDLASLIISLRSVLD